jgi:hypothetical protein
LIKEKQSINFQNMEEKLEIYNRINKFRIKKIIETKGYLHEYTHNNIFRKIKH